MPYAGRRHVATAGLALGSFVLAVIMLICSVIGPAASANAATGSVGELSSEVTDPQNLLGGQVSRVNDEIASTKTQTGVTVRLLYLANFTGTKDPDKWAAETLQSTKPPANTVLLAVASNDGRLVVAVSHNSDDWLKDKKHVSELSQAALGPIQKGDNPDWPGSACAMMEKIKALHGQDTSKKPKIIIAVCIGIVVLLVAVAVVLLVRRCKGSRAKSGSSGKAGETGTDGTVEMTEAGGSGNKEPSGRPTRGPRHRKKH
ncbi:hypothetical protein [Bifidobacterium sp. ESL0745]|uniref:TPM domain-containing protein n=1 Tax=Bifidobacterium sp. ESL0745 TaxID=2983226 RepID=UPI0023F61C3A|nr:hypothetical protein [Bifidobacterium sp. ESL0745]MDF7664918.1 hypothetical protein [Bifidobacterium sp. ESL0745]